MLPKAGSVSRLGSPSPSPAGSKHTACDSSPAWRLGQRFAGSELGSPLPAMEGATDPLGGEGACRLGGPLTPGTSVTTPVRRLCPCEPSALWGAPLCASFGAGLPPSFSRPPRTGADNVGPGPAPQRQGMGALPGVGHGIRRPPPLPEAGGRGSSPTQSPPPSVQTSLFATSPPLPWLPSGAEGAMSIFGRTPSLLVT